MTVIDVKAYIGIGLFIAVVCFNSFSISYLLSAMLFVYVVCRYGDFLSRSYRTLGRDINGAVLLFSLKHDLNKKLSENRGLNSIFFDTVKKYPNKIAVIDIETNRSFTFKNLNDEANKFANYFQSLGYKKDDVVALFMENSVYFVAAWIGLSKIGVITAWINSNLKMESLAHCISTSNAKSIITSKTLYNAVVEVMDSHLINCGLDLYVLGDTSSCNDKNLDALISDASRDEPHQSDFVDFKSVLCFIYTSGTTGLPKAAVIKHYRYYSMSFGVTKSFSLKPSDKIYLSMPLYHTAAGILGVGQMIICGSTIVIRRKFSVSNFWKDCVKYNCTASQYIGEVCRYLLVQPSCPEEYKHKVRLMYGNGLRREIWQSFVDRFGVQIGEVYGSTEGTSNLVNIDGHVGACGFLPISPLTGLLHPVSLVKVDECTGEIVRRPDGLCIKCRPGETGAMVSSIRKSNPLLAFEGYLNANETRKKILKDVFRKGDSVFLSGDILLWDRLGYLYFRDRTGDTFRWKGENVSTTEVESILHTIKSVADATVYGVNIPGHEGRAGMAAIVKSEAACNDDQVFIDEIGQKLACSLPNYAIPVFIRLCISVDKTGTFKLVKTSLQNYGFQLNPKYGKVFYRRTKSGKYFLLDNATHNLFETAKILDI